jgi:hypothetical protein
MNPTTSSSSADLAVSGTACGHRNRWEDSENAPALLLMVGLYLDHRISLSHRNGSLNYFSICTMTVHAD